MKKDLLGIFSAVMLTGGIIAQTERPAPELHKFTRKCGTEIPSEEWNVEFNRMVDKYSEGLQSGRIAAVGYTIPVIVHVIHAGQPVGTAPNISANQINSQLNVVNADFAGTGWNVANLAATAFSAVGAANTEIKFCAATKNQWGQTLPEPGIERINLQDSGWTNPASFTDRTAFKNYIDGVIKAKTIWDPASFLNIWITDENINAVQLLGYATFPSGAPIPGVPGGGGPQNDGVWCWYGCYGNVGNLFVPNNLGRTASHEIGHYLGLRHIGGDGQPGGSGSGNVNGDCTATDYCADTPPQKGGNLGGQYGQNFGNPNYPLHANACPPNDPNGDMFMNFMDYVDDGAMYMFTPNQKTRMQAALASPISVYRYSLTASSATQCTNPATTPSAIVIMASNVCNTVGVITTTNRTTGNPIPTYSWSSNPTAGVTFTPNSTAVTPTITFAAAGVYTITCAATNSVGTNNGVTTVTVDACDVGIAKNSLLNTNISVQPNPSSGKVKFITNLPLAQNLTISVNNMLGQTIFENKYNNVSSTVIELDMSSYPVGVYFFTIDNGKDRAIKRLVISR